MVNKFQISSVTELFDSFGDSTLYRLPQQQKPDACDETMTVEQQNQFHTICTHLYSPQNWY